MRPFTVGADFLVAMTTDGAVGFLRADIAALHNLSCGRVRQLSGDFDVQLQEALEGDIGGEALNPLVGDAVFCSAFWTLHLQENGYVNNIFF